MASGLEGLHHRRGHYEVQEAARVPEQDHKKFRPISRGPERPQSVPGSHEEVAAAEDAADMLCNGESSPVHGCLAVCQRIARIAHAPTARKTSGTSAIHHVRPRSRGYQPLPRHNSDQKVVLAKVIRCAHHNVIDPVPRDTVRVHPTINDRGVVVIHHEGKAARIALSQYGQFEVCAELNDRSSPGAWNITTRKISSTPECCHPKHRLLPSDGGLGVVYWP